MNGMESAGKNNSIGRWTGRIGVAVGRAGRFLAGRGGAPSALRREPTASPLQDVKTAADAPQIPQNGTALEGGVGWVSPSYTSSRAVTLDPETLIANRCVAFQCDTPEADAYRILRTRLLHRMRETGGNTVMVTSALPGEGKTLTSINLALTCAREFRQTVLLVDCDLRRQKIHRYLGYQSSAGLIDYLLHDTPIQDVMVWPGVEKLTVISGGRTIAESSELLGSLRMRELVDSMKRRYEDRIVIFDAPPVLSGADAIAFAPLVEHIVVTARAGGTPAEELQKALAMLPADRVAGLVLNRQDPGATSYYRPGE